MNMKFNVIPSDELELHENKPTCICQPKVKMTYNADYGTMTTDIEHNRLTSVISEEGRGR